MRRWGRDALAAVGLISFVTLFFADILFLGFNLYIRDIARVYYPERQAMANILRTGSFPFWNPLFSAGQPLAANPVYEVFYPPQWLLMLGDFRDAFHAVAILHYPLAALGMFILLRSLGTRRIAAAFGGFSYALGGALVSVSSLVSVLFAMAWLPWLAYFFRRSLKEKRLSDLAFASLVLGLILLAGEVSMILQAGALIGLYALYVALKQRGQDRARHLTWPVIVIAIATLIGAVQVFPALDLQRDSGRSQPFTLDIAEYWHTHPARLLEAIWPTAFGAQSEYAIFFWGGVRFLGKNGLPFLLLIYPGILATIFGITGLLCRSRGWRFVLGCSALSVLLAIGPYGGLFPLLHHAGFKSIRYPEKFLISAIFVLTVFAGVVADEVMSNARVRRIAMLVAATLAVATLAITLISLLPAFPQWFAKFWRVEDDVLDLVSLFRSGFAVSLALLSLAALLLGYERMSPKLRVTALSLLVVVDLGIRERGVMPRITSDYYTPPPVTRMLPKNSRIYSHADWQRANEPQPPIPLGLRHWIIRNGLLPETHMAWGYGGVLETDVIFMTLHPTREFAQLFDSFRAAKRYDRFPLLLQMAGVSHMAILKPYDPEVVSDPRRFDQIDPVRFLKTNNSGRYYFASRMVRAASVLDVAKILGSTEPIDSRTTFLDATPFQPASGRILATREQPNTIDLDVVANGRALLVLAVTPHKYWRASIDGKPAILQRTNVGFQSLVVERGRHRVELRYSNPIVIAGGYASLAGLLVVIALVVADRLRSRSPQPPSPH